MNGLDSETKQWGGKAAAKTTTICSQAWQEGRKPESVSDMHYIQAECVFCPHSLQSAPWTPARTAHTSGRGCNAVCLLWSAVSGCALHRERRLALLGRQASGARGLSHCDFSTSQNYFTKSLS